MASISVSSPENVHYAGILVGVIWWALDRLQHWGDIYHHLVIAPVLVYMGITLLPVIFKNGTKVEKIGTICLIALWAVLVVYDTQTGRLAQRYYLAERGVHLTKAVKDILR